MTTDLTVKPPFGDDEVGGHGRLDRARADRAGQLIVPAEVLARAGMAHGQDVVTEANDEDCYGNLAPVCGECLWAQGIVLCP